jgi:hypothetical protein
MTKGSCVPAPAGAKVVRGRQELHASPRSLIPKEVHTLPTTRPALSSRRSRSIENLFTSRFATPALSHLALRPTRPLSLRASPHPNFRTSRIALSALSLFSHLYSQTARGGCGTPHPPRAVCRRYDRCLFTSFVMSNIETWSFLKIGRRFSSALIMRRFF